MINILLHRVKLRNTGDRSRFSTVFTVLLLQLLFYTIYKH